MALRTLALGILALACHGAGFAEAPPRHLVVFNKPGPNFAAHREHRDAVVAHRELYRDLAARGDILVGGRLSGEPPLGISVFRHGIRQDDVEVMLTGDAAVKLGIIALEFREWELQMGGLHAAQPTPAPAGGEGGR